MLNIAYWDQDPSFDETMYYITNCVYVEDPSSIIPEDSTLIPFSEFCDTYPCHTGPEYFIANAENMKGTVISIDGIPLFSIGDFVKIGG